MQCVLLLILKKTHTHSFIWQAQFVSVKISIIKTQSKNFNHYIFHMTYLKEKRMLYLAIDFLK